ncbi:MAG TPA: hypothetical protein VFR18_20330 [Terriglobia bacterium]|nr:hypothetical protein [Terriglobia bacterium]
MKQALILALITFIVPPALGQTFRSDDPVWIDNDSAIDVKNITRHKLSDHYDFLIHSFGKTGDLTPRPAMNVNTVGEVPDSSWFQNRHAMKRMSIEELVRGPNTGSGPSMDGPWFVIGAKTEGITPGFRIRDSRGDVYFIKFDPPSNPEMATAAEVISTKFFYAMGYNVPENYLAFFTRDQLRVDKKATVTDNTGRERPLTEYDLDVILRRVHQSADARYRAVASKQLHGTPVGPFQYWGTRPDDPNDIFPHEHRRELRGLRVIAAWLNHDDSRAINTLDMLVGQPGRRYVRHYLIDFGSTLGSGSVSAQKPRAGWEYIWEPAPTLKRIATLGLWDKKWVRVDYPDYPSIGRFESAAFEPESWKPEYPNPAFLNATDEDTYWGAKIVTSFTNAEIRAIVKTGQLSDPQAETYLADTLIERRDKVGRYWLTRLSSVDRFMVIEGDLEFQHLASQLDLAPRPVHTTEWFAIDAASGTRRAVAKEDWGIPGMIFMVEITSIEGTVKVHLRERHGDLQIVGVER